MKQKGFSLLFIVIIVALMGIGVAYYLGTQKNISKTINLYSTPVATTSTNVNWKTYSGNDFTFQYPNDWDTFELSNKSIMVAPNDRIEEVKTLYSRGDGFGGGPFLTIIFAKHDNFEDIVPKSDEFATVTSSNVTINNVKGTRYDTTILQSSPMGELGEKIVRVVLPYREKYLRVDLLDGKYEKDFEHILSSLTF